MGKKNDDEIFKYRPDPDHLPDGIYVVEYARHETATLAKGSKKLFMWFRIVEGPSMGVELYKPYNVGVKGFGRRSKYYIDWVMLNRGMKPKKRQVLSPRVFKKKILKIQTRTVVSNWNGKKVPISDQYSVIDAILFIEVG